MQKRSYGKHFVIVAVIVLVTAIITVVGLSRVRWMAAPASAQARSVDSLLGIELVAIGFLFALVMVFMLYSLVAFRQRKGEEEDGDHFEGNTKLEITWTVIPLITVLVLAVLGARGLTEATAARADEMTVEVTAFSWGFKFAYPEQGIEASPIMYLPVDQHILLDMNSVDTDVIHDFWVPEFRVKQDLVPGVPTKLRITPNKIGKYTVLCDELCGTGHNNMQAPIEVVSASDFDAWVAAQQPSTDPAEMASLGAELAASQGCAACHNITGDPGGIGPTWKGLFGHEVELSDGSTVTADDAYIAESIANPTAKIVAGYQPIMPASYGQVLTEQQISYLVAYIKSLQ